MKTLHLTQTTPLHLVLLVASALLTACLPQPPAAVSAELNLEPNQSIRLSWPDAQRANFYRVLENIDGNSGFVPVSTELRRGRAPLDSRVGDGTAASDTTQYSVHLDAAPLHRRLNAQYLVQSCNSAGCTDGPAVSVDGNLATAVSYLKASNGSFGDSFGHALALSADGKTLAIGAPNQINRGDINDIGAVYVFYREAGRWQQQAYLKSGEERRSVLGPNAYRRGGVFLGYSLSLSADGSLLAVGAIDFYNFESAVGLVYLFRRKDDQWLAEAGPLTASNAGIFEHFGYTLSLNAAGTALLVGAEGERSKGGFANLVPNDNTLSGAGAAYLFLADANAPNGWREQAMIKAPTPRHFARFGSALSLTGETDLTLAISDGLTEFPSLTGELEGQVHLYHYAAESKELTYQNTLEGKTENPAERFGTAVSLSADGRFLAVGVPHYDRDYLRMHYEDAPNDYIDNPDAGPGRVELYRSQNGAWQPIKTLTGGGQGGDGFGQALAFSPNGEWLAVGSFGDDNSTLSGVHAEPGVSAGAAVEGDAGYNSGAVFLYQLVNDEWTPSRYIKASNPEASDWFGEAVSVANDGQLAVGASTEDSGSQGVGGDQTSNSEFNSGAVYLY